ncbi:alpha/beta fold hydrolase [Micromonospora sp. NPDC049497]|uniref:alpha/beta fold hydrolase n=1 Tax=Micromonospora sp. NPDC049497 TaxID=3364273 RepID=UPI00379BDE62
MDTAASRDGTRIAYERDGSGPPVILIDAAGHFRANSSLGDLAELLAVHFTVYRYDRRGRGDSTDNPPYTPAREVEDVAALIVEAGEPVSLYGYSSGALVALHAAAAGLDIRRLALLEPPIDPAENSPVQRAFTTRLRELSGEDAVTFFLTEIGVPTDVLAGMRGSPHWAAMVSVAHTLTYDSLLAEATDAGLLARVTTPTLVLDSSGSDDDLTGMAATAARSLPNGVHRSLPGEWHGVPAGTLAPVVADFLRRG